MEKISPLHDPKLVMFVRQFWIACDPLGVYHPDNGNEDEYDAYIDDTIEAIRFHESAYSFAPRMFKAMYGEDVYDMQRFDKEETEFAHRFIVFKQQVRFLFFMD